MSIRQMKNLIKKLDIDDKYYLQNMLNDHIRKMEEEE